MKLIKSFLEEKKGVGIVEYVLLLALLGTTVAVVAPPVREQVGVMYDNHAKKDDTFVGGIEAENAKRVDVGTPSEEGLQPSPNSTVNTAPFQQTPDFTPPTATANQKTVSVEVAKTTNQFDNQYIYDKENYYGTLNKKSNGLTQTIIDQENITTSKEVNKTLTRGTAEEFNTMEQLTESDAEGYAGNLDATGEIRKIMTNTGQPATVTKNSGDVVLTNETHSTDMTYVNSLFPANYSYVEVDPINETKTGYKGTIAKTGAPQRFTIGTVMINEKKNVSEQRNYETRLNVSSLVSEKTFELKTATKGASATNSIVYPTTYIFSDATKEGVLQYKSKASRLVGGLYEYYAIYEGYVHNKQNVGDLAPNTLAYSDGTGYTGVLTKQTAKTVRGLAETEKVGTPKPMTHKEYTTGEFKSAINTQTYSPTYIHKMDTREDGVLNYQSKGAEYSKTVREGHRTETRKETNRDKNAFPVSVSYNSGGYDGMLAKSGTTYVSENRYDVAPIFVTNQTSPNYSVNGYVGTLSKYLASGTYTPFLTREVHNYREVSDTVCITDNACSNLFPNYISHSENGYSGTLWATAGVYFNRTGEQGDYTRSFVTSTLNQLQEPTGQPTYFGHWEKVNTYEAERVYVKRTKSAGYSYGTYVAPGKSTSSQWLSAGGALSQVQNPNLTWDQYYNGTGKNNYTLNDPAAWRAPYYITEWKWVRFLGTVRKDYEGTIIKNATDTRVYKYEGYATQGNYPTKVVAGQFNTVYTDADGYEGRLAKNEVGGVYSAAKSENQNDFRLGSGRTLFQCQQASNGWFTWATINSNVTSSPDTIAYNRSGFVGTLSKVGTAERIGYSPTAFGARGFCNSERIGVQFEQYQIYKQNYSGTVAKPQTDTRVYNYTGNAHDNRIWAQNYSGTVSTPVDYYRHFATYTGNVNTNQYYSTYGQTSTFEGEVDRDTMVNNYRYEQKYNGQLSRDVYEFSYQYERDYTGTLFKTETRDIYQYKQTYEGLVTEMN